MNPNPCKPLTVPSTAEIHEILVKRIDRQKQAAGIVVGVVEPNGRRVIAYGSLANGDPRTVDGNTIFEIGSITKVFTSLVLAEMAGRNEVALDDPAAKYLPEDVRMPERNGKSITLLDLSTHSSGLPRIPDNLKPKDPTNPYADYSVEDLYQFLSSYTLSRDPGSEVEYSNLGAGLLGHLVACRAGMDYESLIGSRITRPLSMPDTGITLSSFMKQRMATGHNAMLAPVANWDIPTLAGAGALRSSANDMLTFLEGFLGYKESPLASAMKTMVEVRRPVGKTKFEIGLGWSILGEIVWHDGGTGGFRSFIGFHPKARVGVIALSNAFSLSGVDDIAMHLLNPEAPLADLDPPEQYIVDPALLDRYTGRYQLPDRILEITRNGDRLFAQVTAAGGKPIAGPVFEMFAESERIFVEQYIHFENDHNPDSVLRTLGENAREDAEPWVGEDYIGGNGVRVFHEQLMKALPDLEMTVQRVHTAEHAILVEVVIRGTHLGAWYDFPATGRRVEFPFWGVYMFDADDRLTGEGICYDRGFVLRQFGVFHEHRGQI